MHLRGPGQSSAVQGRTKGRAKLPAPPQPSHLWDAHPLLPCCSRGTLVCDLEPRCHPVSTEVPLSRTQVRRWTSEDTPGGHSRVGLDRGRRYSYFTLGLRIQNPSIHPSGGSSTTGRTQHPHPAAPGLTKSLLALLDVSANVGTHPRPPQSERLLTLLGL